MDAARKKAMKYVLLPGIVPRVWALVSQGFMHVSYLVALIYGAVRLLPPEHPYLNPANRGRFGVRHVIAQAAKNLEFKRENIDQIFVFFVICLGLAILVIQFVLLCMALLTQQYVLAQTTIFPFQDVLTTSSQYNEGPEQDIAFILFDRIFGLGGLAGGGGSLIFGSCISNLGVPCLDMNDNPIATPTTYPFPIHIALHQLLEFYTRGVFFVAVIILIYFAATMVAETAVSGTPFGQRTNKLWMPIRIIVFFFLLIPLNTEHGNGLNIAQIITFWTAKIGSNFATNAWNYYTQEVFTATNTYAGDKNKLIATPTVPEVHAILQFMYIAKTCKYISEGVYPDELSTGSNTYVPKHDGIQAYVVRPPGTYVVEPGLQDALELDATNFDQARRHSDYGNITIAFGVRNTSLSAPQRYRDSWGSVVPHCGQITVPVTSAGGGATLSGVGKIQETYYKMIQDMWLGTSGFDFGPYAECQARRASASVAQPNCTPVFDYLFMQMASDYWKNRLTNEIHQYIDDEVNNADWDVPQALRKKGWAGAGIWYNRIARINGDITGAVLSIPTPTKYPDVMEAIVDTRRTENEGSSIADLFDPAIKGGIPVKYPMQQERDEEIATVLYAAFQNWANDGVLKNQFQRNNEGSILIRAINWLFGSAGIYDMRDNADIHPLAQLSALGKSMMEASARNIGAGLAGSGLDMLMKNDLGKLAATFGSFLKTLGIATLAMSFVMFYILPLQPFMYFFFAVSSWVKSIFEAIVAMPLWALAHVRIDGDGLPGQYAANGYFLLFEIFLRPVLIIFGLIASIIIFASLIEVLNGVFSLVVSSVAGFDAETNATAAPNDSLNDFLRGPVDQFMYTVIYVVVVFLIGQSCFKLIDLIPDQILRWAGSSVKGFQENAGDPAGDAMSMTYQGIQLGTKQIKGGALALL